MMNDPEIPFNRSLATPLYQQVYVHLRSSILAGKLKGGGKLPSTRALAEELGVSRNNILSAYQQLLSEGYVDGAVGSGTYVARVLPEHLLTPPEWLEPTASKTVEPRPRFSGNARRQLAAPQMSRLAPSPVEVSPRPFRFGIPDLKAFPYKLWARLVIRQARQMPASAFTYQNLAGYPPLREAIAAHVTVSRGVHCTADQILIYHYTRRPLPALQGLDAANRVIYIGTFSKVLFPALRLGFLILPPPLVGAFQTVRSLVDTHPPILEQAVLAAFIGEGHLARHLRRMRRRYAECRAALLEAAQSLPLEVIVPEAGLHCVAWLPDGMDDRALVQRASEEGVDLVPVSNFCSEPLARKGILLGYSEYSVEQIKEGVQRLAMAMRAFLPKQPNGSIVGSGVGSWPV